MANVPKAPWMGFGQNYAQGQAAAYDPMLAAITSRISGLQGRSDAAGTNVGNLFQGASGMAGRMGQDVSNIGEGFGAAMQGVASSLPGMDPTTTLNALRSTGRGGATAALTGNILGTQVETAKANSILEAQRRIADEIKAEQDKYDAAQLEKNRVGADWMTPAAQRQQMATGALNNQQIRATLAQIPAQNRAQWLANKAAQGSIDSVILTNLGAMKKLGLSQKDMIKARKLYGGIKAKGASGTSGGSGGPPPVSPASTDSVE